MLRVAHGSHEAEPSAAASQLAGLSRARFGEQVLRRDRRHSAALQLWKLELRIKSGIWKSFWRNMRGAILAILPSYLFREWDNTRRHLRPRLSFVRPVRVEEEAGHESERIWES